MTVFDFGGSPVPSIKVGPINTDTISLFVLSCDSDDDDGSFWKGAEGEEEKKLEILLDLCCNDSSEGDKIFDLRYWGRGLENNVHGV